jgi:hypothetical protein
MSLNGSIDIEEEKRHPYIITKIIKGVAADRFIERCKLEGVSSSAVMTIAVTAANKWYRDQTAKNENATTTVKIVDYVSLWPAILRHHPLSSSIENTLSNYVLPLVTMATIHETGFWKMCREYNQIYVKNLKAREYVKILWQLFGKDEHRYADFLQVQNLLDQGDMQDFFQLLSPEEENIPATFYVSNHGSVDWFVDADYGQYQVTRFMGFNVNKLAAPVMHFHRYRDEIHLMFSFCEPWIPKEVMNEYADDAICIITEAVGSISKL